MNGRLNRRVAAACGCPAPRGPRESHWDRRQLFGAAVPGLLICLTGMALLACGSSAEQRRSHAGEPVVDQVSFIDRLRQNGFAVEILGDLEQPFLQVPGTRVQVGEGAFAQPAELQLFQYESQSAARSDVNRIDRAGNPQGMRITWVAPPHFFQSGRLIVLYLGSDAAVLGTLTEWLGPEVAGSG
jgi:hypothetical protein